MMRRAVSALVCLVLAGCAQTETLDIDPSQIQLTYNAPQEPYEPYFPPEVEGDSWIRLAMFKEPKLHTEDGLGAYKTRYRMSLSGVSCRKYAIRIDVPEEGPPQGTFKRHGGCAMEPFVDRPFEVTNEQVAELEALIAEANMFRIYPQFWVLKNDADYICIDGTQILMERRTQENWRVSIANAQCTAPTKVRAVAYKMLDLAGSDAGARLLN